MNESNGKPGAHILVVDDEPDLEALITQRFRRKIRAGELSFRFARDGQQALDVLDGAPEVDMVLSDINMPRMDGLTLLGRLHDLHEDLRAVIVSAYGDIANIRTAMNRGAFDFLTKRIEFDDLEATITKTLDNIAKLRQLQHAKLVAEQAKTAMSRYFSPSVARYLEHEGTVMKIVGDAVHVMFGAPVEQSDHAARAVACALAMDAFATAFQARQNEAGIPLGETRIGVNSGVAVVGNFGGENFFDYTAHGDSINVAARLESANKHLGTRICVSGATAGEIEGFRGRPVGHLVLKGKSEPLEAFEPLDEAAFAADSTRAYNAAFGRLASGDPAASQLFAACVGQFGSDPLATFHLRRLLAGEQGVRIELAGK